MQSVVEFLIAHGYAVLLAAVLIDQLGLPMPGVPFLLAAGALARSGVLHPAGVLALVAGASFAAHALLFWAGRRGGGRILRFLCRLSLEPDSCVRATEEMFAKSGPHALVFARFVPGLDTLTAPLAGSSGMRFFTFAAWDLLGALLWAAPFLTLGFVLGHQLEALAAASLQLGAWLGAIFGGAFALYIGYKVVQRHRLLRSLRVARITPRELHARLHEVFVVDLRHARDFESDPRSIPGALRLSTDEVRSRHEEIPRDRDIALYCT